MEIRSCSVWRRLDTAHKLFKNKNKKPLIAKRSQNQEGKSKCGKKNRILVKWKKKNSLSDLQEVKIFIQKRILRGEWKKKQKQKNCEHFFCLPPIKFNWISRWPSWTFVCDGIHSIFVFVIFYLFNNFIFLVHFGHHLNHEINYSTTPIQSAQVWFRDEEKENCQHFPRINIRDIPFDTSKTVSSGLVHATQNWSSCWNLSTTLTILRAKPLHSVGHFFESQMFNATVHYATSTLLRGPKTNTSSLSQSRDRHF